MKTLLALAHRVDALNRKIALLAVWMVLLSCLVSAGNALIRYGFDMSSNAWLELQWYMFAAMVMLGAPHVLKTNEHVRVDVLYSSYTPRRAALVDLLGMAVFLMPAAILIAAMSWPFLLESIQSNEMSSNAGGLIRWPVKLVIPLGAVLLALQGVAEMIKRVAFLRGEYAMDTHYERPHQ